MVWASLLTQTVKNLQCRRSRFDPWVGKVSWRREWQPTPVFLPGEAAWTQEPGGLQFTGSQSVGYDWTTKREHNTGKADEAPPPSTGRARGASCVWATSAFKRPGGLPRFFSISSGAASSLGEAMLSPDYYKWKTWFSACSFFPLLFPHLL